MDRRSFFGALVVAPAAAKVIALDAVRVEDVGR